MAISSGIAQPFHDQGIKKGQTPIIPNATMDSPKTLSADLIIDTPMRNMDKGVRKKKDIDAYVWRVPIVSGNMPIKNSANAPKINTSVPRWPKQVPN